MRSLTFQPQIPFQRNADRGQHIVLHIRLDQHITQAVGHEQRRGILHKDFLSFLVELDALVYILLYPRLLDNGIEFRIGIVAVGGVAISGDIANVEIRFADVAVGVGIFFIGLEGKDSGHTQIVFALFFLAPESFVVGDQAIGAADAQDGREFPIVSLAIVVGDDPIDDVVYPLWVLKELLAVDAVDLLVDQRTVLLLELSPILDGELEHVVVGVFLTDLPQGLP